MQSPLAKAAWKFLQMPVGTGIRLKVWEALSSKPQKPYTLNPKIEPHNTYFGPQCLCIVPTLGYLEPWGTFRPVSIEPPKHSEDRSSCLPMGGLPGVSQQGICSGTMGLYTTHETAGWVPASVFTGLSAR